MNSTYHSRTVISVAITIMATVVSANETWLGGFGNFMDATKWSGGWIPISGDTLTIDNGQVLFNATATQTVNEVHMGTNDVSAPLFIMESGVLKPSKIMVGYMPGSSADVIQTNGTITLTCNTYADAGISLGYAVATNGVAPTSTYTLVNGTLNLPGNIHVGARTYGHFIQQGGLFDVKTSWFSIGRYDTGVGVFDITGGLLFLETADNGALMVGEEGKGTLNVGGAGIVRVSRYLEIGNGTVNLNAGGRIEAPYVVQRSGGKTGTFNFNGGTLARYGSQTLGFLNGLLGGTYIKDGGATIEIGSGYESVIAQNLLAADGATAGTLVKTGDGILTLTGANTYLGATTVSNGTLVVAGDNALPGLSAGRVSVKSGAALSLEANLLTSDLAATLVTVGAFEVGSSLGLDTRNGSAVNSAVLPVSEGGSFQKTGANALTLTGANTYTAETIIQNGTLCAEKGTGIPSASHIRFAGGTWAPLNETTVTRSLGTDANALNGTIYQMAGFSAIGSDLNVNLGGSAAAIDVSDVNNFASGGLYLNGEDSDSTVTFANPINFSYAPTSRTINWYVRSRATASTANAVLAGAITDSVGGHNLVFDGVGPRTFTAPFTVKDQIYAYDGPYTLKTGNTATNTALGINLYYGATLKIRDDSVFHSNGNACHIGLDGYGALDIDSGALYIDNWLAVAQNSGSSALMTITGGEINANRLNIGNRGSATINQSGGKVIGRQADDRHGIGEFDNTANIVGKCYWNLSGGEFGAYGYLHIGTYGYGEVNQTGGREFCGNWESIGRYAGSEGRYNLSGGLLEVYGSSAGLIIGEAGKGTLNISGSGVCAVTNGVYLSGGTGTDEKAGAGSLNINDGGTLITTFLSSRGATNGLAINMNGGTIQVPGSGKSSSLLRGISAGQFHVGPKGGTLDTGNNTVTIPSTIIGASEGTFTKTGSGSLLLTAGIPLAGRFAVAEGTAKIMNASTSQDQGLVHRWSFNNSLVDSIGGQDAAVGGYASFENGTSVYLNPSTDASHETYIDLGDNVLPADGSSVTMEIWATEVGIRAWSRVFDFGSTTSDYILMAWSEGTSTTSYPISVAPALGNKAGPGPYTLGTEYHLAVVIEPFADSGSTRLTFYRQNATTGATENKVTYTVGSGWSIASLTQSNCWLGRSQWPDKDANAFYNECRVWRRALTQTQLEASAAAGPDALPDFGDVDSTVASDNAYPDAASDTLKANDYLVHRWNLNGNLTDSVTGMDAAWDGSASLSYSSDKTSVVLPGGAKGTGAIDIGDNVLPSDGTPVTIELWATRTKDGLSWPRMFDIGDGNGASNNYTFLSFNNVVSVKGGFGDKTGPGVGDLNVPYHFAMVFGKSGDKWVVTAYRQDVISGRTLGKVQYTINDTAWTLATIPQTYCWIGRSNWPDSDAGANYNEFRIWNAALSEAQLSINAKLGPDALPFLSDTYTFTCPVVQVDDGAVLDLNGLAYSQQTIAGAGSVQNGKMTVTKSVEPDGTLMFVGNTTVTGDFNLDLNDGVEVDGTLDISDATLSVKDLTALKTLKSGWVVASASQGITGTFKSDNLAGTGYGVFYINNTVVIAPKFLVIELN